MVIAVDSVVYNMAGEIEDRPNYLKSLVARHMLSETKESMADTIRNGYFNGPGMRLRAFYRWASSGTHYDKVGFPSGKLEAYGKIPAGKVAQQISAPAGYTVSVQSAVLEYADPQYWADRYMLNNHPELFLTAWDFDYFRDTNEIRIDFETGPNERFTPAGFDYDARYIFAYYSLIKDNDNSEDISKVLIYKIGSGNADLDALAKNKADFGQFFPFIPVRLDNTFISNAYKPSVYEQTTAAYEKATSGDLKELVEELKKNDDLGDIDHIYVVFGTSLNTEEDAAKKYIYHFFEALQLIQEGGAAEVGQYLADTDEFNRKASAYDSWVKLKKKARKGKEPKTTMAPSRIRNKIRIKGTGDVNSYYDVRIKWDHIQNFTFKGRGRPGARAGDLWFKAESTTVGYERRTVSGSGGNRQIKGKPIKSSKLKLYWQRTGKEYTLLEVTGAEYENTIYKGKAVKITAKEALDDNDESGFIIPLHYDIWRKMSMVDTTQMSMACVYSVFNCYKERKRKWYESGIFRIFLVIVIAIATAVFTGGAGFGLLGAHMAVGSAFGLSGISAAILGSVVNAMAALVLTTVIEKVTQGLGVLGPLVGFLLGAVIGQVTAAISSGGAFTFNWSSLLNVDNLLKLTQAVGNTVVAAIQEDTLGIQEKWMDFQENAEDATSKIQQAYFNEFGYGAGAIDPMMLLEPRNDMLIETPNTFLTRTLMTGSEIAEMSRELLYDFPKYSLELPDAFSR